MVIILENKIGGMSSNPVWSCVSFCQISLEKVINQYVLPSAAMDKY